MKKQLLIILLLAGFHLTGMAAHIKGGFFTYSYIGPGTGTNLKYHITLTVYMICDPNSGQLSNPINFSFFNANTNAFIRTASVNLTNQYTLSKVYDEPCISGDQTGCKYTIVIYDLPSIELPALAEGYIVSYQRCCRIAGIQNVIGSSSVGTTFTTKIPGTSTFIGAEKNNSPNFLINDTAVICSNNYFQYSFAATDPDNDSLSYEFCDAYSGGATGTPAPDPAANPPYSIIPYAPGFNGSQPLGSSVTINPLTGLISGIAPGLPGQYVICVCVSEYRNGILIEKNRKELHIEVGDCSPLRVQLNPRPAFCKTGLTVSFQNDASGNPAGSTYLWDFGDPASGAVNNSSTNANTNHTFSAAGTYTVKLKVSLAGTCTDSSSTIIRVYPGFYPGFTTTGICYLNPFQFTDTTRANYGNVDSWSWDFGDLTTLADTSHRSTPTWTYPNGGVMNVRLIVTSDVGCVDTIQKQINVLDKPILTLGFTDTLICQFDTIPLNANGVGTFNWTPPINMINPTTANPRVYPMSSTWYYVHLTDAAGCTNTDSVQVRVTTGVFITPMGDSTICQGDTVRLRISSNGLAFNWTPAGSLDNSTLMTPLATVNSTTTYQVTGIIGGCNASKQIKITTIPYPVSQLAADTTICYKTPIRLNPNITGSSFNWSPTTYLSNPRILNPIVTSPDTIRYILSVYDTLGCPKPGRDTIQINVLPEVIAFAGRDTTVVVGQPLQFNASGGTNYTWTPATGLSSTIISNPIGIYSFGTDTVKYRLVVKNASNCPDTAYVMVRIFRTAPSIFVPSAFTPNNDGLNDIFKPITAGIKKINYFRVFNRWGQLVYQTSIDGAGWDGKINGQIQSTNVYVWVVSAVDYLGKDYFAKGTVTLIR